MTRVVLRAARLEDDLRGRAWAADEELGRLAPGVRAASTYKEYAIEVEGKLIGYASIYNLTPDESELGIVIGSRDYWHKGYGGEVVNQLTGLCLGSLGLKRVHLKVLESNNRAIRCYQKCGFKRYGARALDGHSFILMEKRAPTMEPLFC